MKKKIIISILGVCIFVCILSATACTKHEHDLKPSVTAPTCVEQGFTTYICKCGKSYIDNYVSATGHSFTNYLSDNNATETQNGTKTARCDNANCSETDTVIDEGSAIMQGELRFSSLTVEGNNVYGKVSNATATFDFTKEIVTLGNTEYVVSLDEFGIQTSLTKTVPLKEGDNNFFIFENVDGALQNTYTVTIRRRQIYTVTFNSNGGTVISSQQIEEDSFATVPKNPEKSGYTFINWDYDFSNPVTQSVSVNANWLANENTKYTVNYYLQNLEDNDYTLQESEELFGTTDTTATAVLKNFNHFTYNQNKSNITANINGDGSAILNVYYTRNTYTLSINNSTFGSITNAGTYKYGKQISSTATPNLGYSFTTWTDEDNKELSFELTYTFTIESNVVAKFEVKPELANFEFTSTLSECAITGIKDKTVTDIVIPNYVTSIGGGALSGCSSLESITIPFVGDKAGKTSSDTYQYPFGYIFGSTSYTGGTATKQYYYGSSTSSITSTTYYIPSSLKSVTVTGGNILYGAFYNCSNLTSVTIPNSVTSIGNSAFV